MKNEAPKVYVGNSTNEYVIWGKICIGSVETCVKTTFYNVRLSLKDTLKV
jgi:hypothetical protein